MLAAWLVFEVAVEMVMVRFAAEVVVFMVEAVVIVAGSVVEEVVLMSSAVICPDINTEGSRNPDRRRQKIPAQTDIMGKIPDIKFTAELQTYVLEDYKAQPAGLCNKHIVQDIKNCGCKLLTVCQGSVITSLQVRYCIV